MRRQATSIERSKSRTPRFAGTGVGVGSGTPVTGTACSRRRPASGLPLAQVVQRRGVVDLARQRVGHLGLVEHAAAQQPGQPAVDLVPRRRPPRDDLGLRTGQRDVRQPDVVAGHLRAALGGDLVVAGTAGAADVEAAGAVGLVVEHGLTHPDVAVERERQVDERVLQALADPDGHDLDRGRVAVEPTVALGRAGPLLALVAQPLQQGRQPETVAVGDLVEQLREVLHVGEVALAAAHRRGPARPCRRRTPPRARRRCRARGRGRPSGAASRPPRR